MNFKKKFLCTVMAMLMGSIIGCSKQSAPATSKSAESGKMEKVSVAIPTVGEHWLPVWIADKKGFFKEEGLDVSFVKFNGGPLVISSLLAGESQFALTGYDQVLKTFDKGKSTKMIIATSTKHPWSLMVSKDIKSFSDLKGKKIGSGMEGSSPRAFVRASLKYGGLDTNKDVEYVSIPSGSEIGALEKGEIAGTYVGGINKEILIKKGFHTLVDLADSEQHKKVLGYDEYPLYVVQTSDNYIKDHPENVQKFTNAVVKGLRWQNSHSTEEIADVIAPVYPNLAKDDLVGVVKDIMPLESKDGYFTQVGHDSVEKLSLDVKMIDKKVPMDKVVDQTFIKKANEKIK